ncbi:MAG: Ca-activated chloride channel [Blastocatellia bacterium]|nr:Ca-activated chloride channel [Blastocatellia bacterium]
MLLHHEALSRIPTSPRAALSLLRSIRRIALLLTLISLLSSASHVVRAQTETPQDEADIVRVRTDLVTVPLFVADRSGQRVFGLTLDDFGAQADGRNLKLEYFAAGTEHVALAFALDASGSAREIIRQQSEAALALFSRFGSQSRVAVWRFGARPQLVTDFTTDLGLARQGFGLTVNTDERTAIFDAAAAAIHSFDKQGSDPAERRILILISDGLDTASRTKPQAVIDEAGQRAVSIYVIHLPLYAPRDGRLQPRPAAKGFRALAGSTGGRYFMVGDARAALDPRSTIELGPVFKAIEDDLRGQYVVGFYPDDASRDGRFHRLSVNLTARRNRQLRLRQLREGYVLKQ